MSDGIDWKTSEPLLSSSLETSLRASSYLAEPPTHRRGAKTLIIRELDRGGHFERSLRCFPGRLSVLLQPLQLRRAKDSISVQLRFGLEILHLSEVAFCDPAHLVSISKAPFAEILNAKGLVREHAEQIAREIGLEDALQLSPGEMTVAQRRLAAILLLTLDRSRVVVFDSPFAGLRAGELERAAEFILKAAQKTLHTDQIYLVTAAEKMPTSWRKNEAVHNLSRGTSHHRGLRSVRSFVKKARELFTPHLEIEAESSRVVTRPQRIMVQATPLDHGINNEVIVNPSSPLPADLPPAEVAGKDTATLRRHSLTKVTTTMRIARAIGLRSLWSRIVAANVRRREEAIAPLPRNVRVELDHQRAKVRLRILLGILFALIALCAFMALSA